MKQEFMIGVMMILCICPSISHAQERTKVMENKKVTAGRDAFNDFAPKFAEMNDDVLFGEIWSREKELSARDRSLITVSALFGAGILNQLFQSHLQKAKENGITKDEITEVITQLAFYSGWPKAWAALYLAKSVFEQDEKDDTPREILFGRGELNVASEYFIGKSYVASMVDPTPENPMQIANVTFEPGCRNNWHRHSGEQILLVTEGKGWYQEVGKAAQALHKGDVVVVPSNVKHWHGAAADSWFTHISIAADVISGTMEWLEPVSEEEYNSISLIK